jgi:hypothetical protein
MRAQPMRTLHTYRFTGEHATLSILETADRARVVMQMDGDSSAFEELAVTLAAPQWYELCAFNPFTLHRSGDDVLRGVRFCDADHGDVLEISETRSGDVVMLEMRNIHATDPDDALTMFLSRSQWRQLVALDLVGDGASAASLGALYAVESNGTVH